MKRFRSILFDQPGSAPDAVVPEPGCFGDLNLDQVRDAMLEGREEYDLAPLFQVPLHDPASVAYRQAVVRDLDGGAARAPVETFARRMRLMRDLLAREEKTHYELQKQRLYLEAVELYCGAVRGLERELTAAAPASDGFRQLIAYLGRYVRSKRFISLAADTHRLLEALAAIRYSLNITDNRVRVGTYEAQRDYSVEITETFAKFNQGSVGGYKFEPLDQPHLNHIEAQVLDLVARLHPDEFTALAEFCEHHRQFLDPTVGSFDREVQLYLAYLDYVEPLRAGGLRFCYPEVSASSKDVYAQGTFDLALAAKLRAENSTVVCNGFELNDPERILVVTGPNQGGKTTFARMFGQLHHLCALGLPVPGERARLFLPDRVFTHFEREEQLETLRGKLDDELVRIHEILTDATGDSVVVLNESFSSTTLADALRLGTELIGRLTELDALSVYVTFVDELSSLNQATVSMVATVSPDDATLRTFKLLRRPADGLAYAAALAHKYGLGYETLIRRVAA